MEYVIVTTEWCDNKGIVIPSQGRRSLDGNKVILHKDFIEPVLTKEDDIEVYGHNDGRLTEILDGEEWCEKIEDDEELQR